MPQATGVFVPGHAVSDLSDVQLEEGERERQALMRAPTLEWGADPPEPAEPVPRRLPLSVTSSPNPSIQRINSSGTFADTLLEADPPVPAATLTDEPMPEARTPMNTSVAPATDERKSPAQATGDLPGLAGTSLPNATPPQSVPRVPENPSDVSQARAPVALALPASSNGTVSAEPRDSEKQIEMQGTIYTDGTYWKRHVCMCFSVRSCKDQPLCDAAQERQRAGQSGDGEAVRYHSRAHLDFGTADSALD